MSDPSSETFGECNGLCEIQVELFAWVALNIFIHSMPIVLRSADRGCEHDHLGSIDIPGEHWSLGDCVKDT